MANPKDKWLASILAELNKLPGDSTLDLYKISDELQKQLHDALQTSKQSMLPSYTSSLPKENTAGTAIALDLGGSTLRIAIIQLQPQLIAQREDSKLVPGSRKIIVKNSWAVEDDIKSLKAKDFFDWIANRVRETVTVAGIGNAQKTPVGVTWSFPITQTSPASGNAVQMGKGYAQWREIVGTDLRSHFEGAFARLGLPLYMNALINDTEATFLSHVFANPFTSISLILGTGLNCALRLPVSVFAAHKLGERSWQWVEQAAATLVNTEISMFGADIFPTTEADRTLDANSTAPGFQPLEQMCSGRYLGEIVRLVLQQGIEAGLLFDGIMPVGLQTQFGFDTGKMAILENCSVEEGIKIICKVFRCQHAPPRDEVKIIQSICRAVSDRAAVYLAIALFTLWKLQRTTMLADLKTRDFILSYTGSIAIAYCGTVVEKHPTIRIRIQQVLDLLVDNEPAHYERHVRLVLEEAGNSGLLGAAVASVMNAMNDDIITRSRL